MPVRYVACIAMLALTLACSTHHGPQVGGPPQIESDDVLPRHLIKEVSLSEAIAKLDITYKHAEAVSLSTEYQKGDSIWFYCRNDHSLDSSFSPERGFILVRGRSILKTFIVYPPVPVSSLSQGDCSNYPYTP